MQDKLKDIWCYRYLCNYYSYTDDMSIYGITRMEIKHSKFLCWLLNPESNQDLGDFPLRKFLITIQKSAKLNNLNEKFCKIDLKHAKIDEITVDREKGYIDLIINAKINDVAYVFNIENKIEASLYNKLDNYKKRTQEMNPDVLVVSAFLYYKNDERFLKKVLEAEYIPFTYQDVYDNVLKEVLTISINSKTRDRVYDYIHALANVNEQYSFLITTDEEKKFLRKLFENPIVISIIEELLNKKERVTDNLFYIMLKKYLSLENDDSKLYKEINLLINGNRYILNWNSYSSIGKLLKAMMEKLFENYPLNKLNEKLNSLYSNPIFVSEEDLEKLKNKNYYWEEFTVNDKKYYVFSYWRPNEYEELKEKINNANLGVTLK